MFWGGLGFRVGTHPPGATVASFPPEVLTSSHLSSADLKPSRSFAELDRSPYRNSAVEPRKNLVETPSTDS